MSAINPKRTIPETIPRYTGQIILSPSLKTTFSAPVEIINSQDKETATLSLPADVKIVEKVKQIGFETKISSPDINRFTKATEVVQLKNEEVVFINSSLTNGTIQNCDLLTPYDDNTSNVDFQLQRETSLKPKKISLLSKWCGYCKDHRSYNVSYKLKTDWRCQAYFFTKAMISKSFQILLFVIWIYFLTNYCEGYLVRQHNWMYISLVFYLIVQCLVRFFSDNSCSLKEKGNNLSAIACSLFAMIISSGSLAIYCSSVAVYHNTTVFRLIACIMLMSTLAVAIVVPYTLRVHMFKYVNTVAGTFITLVVSLIFTFLKVYDNDKTLIQFLLKVWLPGLVISECIMLMMFYEIRKILLGYRFDVKDGDWLYTSIYI